MHIFPKVIKQVISQLFESPLFYRIYYNDIAGVREYCQTTASPGELNGVNRFGLTPLGLAVKGKNMTMIQILIDFGADINGRDEEGRTPFMHALLSKSNTSKKEILDLLLKNGADINQPDKMGRGSVFYALEAPADIFLPYVLIKGGNPNQQASDGSTPVLLSIQKFRLENIRRLMENGADMYAENKKGVTPWQLAKQSFSQDTYQSLKKFEHELLIRSARKMSSRFVKTSAQKVRD